MMPTEARIREELNAIIDPCSVAAGDPAGLDDMGLVYDVAISAGGVHVTLGTTHPYCMMAAVFMSQAEARLLTLPDVETVSLSLHRGEIWTPSRFSPAYLERRGRNRRDRNP